MNLQGRDLRVGLQGDDVKLLQDELVLLGFPIAGSVRAARSFDDNTTLLAVKALQQAHGLPVTGIVDAETARLINVEVAKLQTAAGRFVVKGQVRDAADKAVVGALVRAFDKDMRREEPLGEKRTDAQGYQITYTAEQFARAEKGTADLRVAVFNDAGLEVVSSLIIFNAKPVETVDLVTPGDARPLSEYTRHVADLSLPMQGVPFEDLTEPDISFLAGDTEIDIQRIRWLVEAAKRARETAASQSAAVATVHLAVAVAPTAPAIPPEFFYGLFRQNVSMDKPLETLRSAIETSIRDNVIPVALRDRLDAVMAVIQTLKAGMALKPAAQGQRASLGDLLATLPVPLELSHQIAIATAVSQVGNGRSHLGEQLQAAGLGPEQVVAVDRTLRLGDLTLQHPPLVQALQAIVSKDADASLRSLATLKREEWIDLAYTHGTPIGARLDPGAFALTMEAKIEELHPTAVLATRIGAGALPLDEDLAAEIGTFLKNNPTFDLVNANVQAFAAGAKFDGVTDREGVTGSLLTFQRLRTLSATWDEAGAMKESGIESSFNIARMGRPALHEILADRVDPARVDTIFDRALTVHDTSMALAVNFLPRFAPPDVNAKKKRKRKSNDTTALKDFPTLQSLFGPLDYCRCSHCQSVLSPAAYFVDLLEFLRRKNRTPQDALLERRPDLADLELSCANTETELPYIDLVLEILENAVALPLPIDLPLGTDGEAALKLSPLADPGLVTDGLRKTVLDLGKGLNALEDSKGWTAAYSQWTVTDRHRRWTLHYSRQKLFALPEFFWSVPRRPMDLTGIDLPLFLKGLDQGKVDPGGASQFQQLFIERGASRYLRLMEYTIVPVEPGLKWTVTYKMGFVVSIDTAAHKMTLSAPDGTAIVSEGHGTGALLQMAAHLDTTPFPKLDPIQAYLPSPLQQFRVTKDPQHANVWIVKGRLSTLHLQYTPERLSVAALTYQSEEGDQDLKATPLNHNPVAYEILKGASFPWSLPFDLPLEEVRVFLERAGVSRLHLMDLCNPTARFSDDAIAREVLGLSEEEANLIETTAVEPRVWSLWGLTVGTNGQAEIYDASAGADVTDLPLTLLTHASIAMQEARLSFGELQDVLQTRFVSASNVSFWPLDECEPTKMRLTGLAPDHPDRLHRFVRLWRRLGWEVYELDLALASVQPISASFGQALRRLSHLKRLHELLGLPLEVLASWWGGFGGPVYRRNTKDGAPAITPLYDRLFLNPLVRNPPDADFQLNKDRTELLSAVSPKVPKTISEKTTSIAAALGVRQQDLTLLVAPSGSIADTLTLSRLRDLYRIVSLAKSLRLSLADYSAVRSVIGLDPFAGTEEALAFYEAEASLRQSGFTIDEVSYLLHFTYQFSAGSTPLFSTVWAEQTLRNLLGKLQSVRNEAQNFAVPALEQLRAKLTAIGWNQELIDEVTGGLASTGPFDAAFVKAFQHQAQSFDLPVFREPYQPAPALAIPPELAKRCYYDGAAKEVVFVGWMSDKDRDALKPILTANAGQALLKLKTASDAYIEPSGPNAFLSVTKVGELFAANQNPDSRARSVLGALLPKLCRDAAIDFLGQAVGLEPIIARELLDDRLTHPTTPASRLVDAFLEPGFLDIDLRAGSVLSSAGTQAGALLKLKKVALACARQGVVPAQLAWLGPAQGGGLVFSGLSLDGFPCKQGDAPATFADWRQLLALFKLRDSKPIGPILVPRVFELLNPDDPNQLPGNRAVLHDFIAALLNLSRSDIDATATQLQLQWPAGYQDAQKLSALLDLLLALRRLGATAADAPGLVQSQPGEADAAVARKILRSRYDAKAWAIQLRTIVDDLRPRQRNALVDYLITHDGLRDETELYDRYLIDVEMGACMTTTRILQATAAVQLFVQRCLLNVEPNVAPTAIDAGLWDWMKNYRVWEANRKVFLWPENWLYPELRDDKTETFRELEGALSQNEPSDDSAQQALLTYLDGLNELARIEVVGMYDDRDPSGSHPRTLYVVGRTPNQPYRYFWRQCQGFDERGMQWSGWGRIDLDISGDHVVPFVLEGDFHVAWPVINKKSDSAGNDHWEIRLAWARRTTRGWSHKKVSRGDPLRVPAVDGKDERGSFVFRAHPTQQTAPFTIPPKPPDTQHTYLTREGVTIYCYAATGPETPPPDTPGVSASDFFDGFARLTVNGVAYEQFSDGTYGRAGKKDIWLNAVGPDEDPNTIGLGSSGTEPAHEVAAVYDLGLNKVSTTGDNGVFYFDIPASAALHPPEMSQKLQQVKFSLLARDKTNTPVALESITLSKASCLWHPVLKLDLGHTAPAAAPPSVSGPESPVVMSLFASMDLSAGEDSELSPFSNGPDFQYPTPATPPETVPMSGGYLENAGVTSLAIDSATWLRSTPNRFFLLPAGPSTLLTGEKDWSKAIWHYRDDGRRCFVWLRSESAADKLVVLSDGIVAAQSFRVIAGWGLEYLFSPAAEALSYNGKTFADTYQPAVPIDTQTSVSDETVSFDSRVPGALYNKELFLHAPLLVGSYLSQQQRFQDAHRWLQFVYDPTSDRPGPDSTRSWVYRPFRDLGQPTSIDQRLQWLADPSIVASEKEDFRNSIEIWRQNPFRPHVVARLREGAPYQWRTIFSYLDNLIAWGDQLFRRDTRESINEATLLYVLAAKLLGPRPRSIAPWLDVPALTYRSVPKWDDFGNAWVAFADLPLIKAWLALVATFGPFTPPGERFPTPLLTSLGTLYFCVPNNEKLLEYWDRVEDRLFKIRHCENIDGVERELPLFDPPIDPELLVRATAAGVDIATVLADRAVLHPNYRFTAMLPKAFELCGEVKGLAASLLSAREKQDVEGLALLRSSQEIGLLKLVTQIKEEQAAEAKANLEALRQSETITLERLGQYQRLLGKQGVQQSQGGLPVVEQSSPLQVATDATGDAAGLGLARAEQSQIEWSEVGLRYTVASGISSTVSSVLHSVPDISVGEFVVTKFGGSHLGNAAGAVASFLNMLASNAAHQSNRSSLFAGWQRRADDWVHQSKLALGELVHIRQQIAAAEIRVAITEREFDNHQKQIENAEALDDFMRDKFTNQQLFSWMVGEISAVYFRAYQLAYDVAKKAETAYRFELGLEESHFIQFGYWDSLKKGLLASERLAHDLKRMEVAYLDQNKREYEVTKHVSLATVDPVALILLRQTGECYVNLPEVLFDLDYPGHYMRRIKSVSVTIPAVTGPYTGISCTLTLRKSSVRNATTFLNSKYARDETAGQDDSRFTDSLGTIQSIVTSTGQNDSGLFETNLRDERYLPFEGAGAISEWRLELPTNFPQFDYDTISDVILHVRYTAREGGSALKEKAASELEEAVNTIARGQDEQGLVRVFSAKHEFPNEWYSFLNPTSATGDQKFSLVLSKERFPFLFRQKKVTIQGVSEDKPAIEFFLKKSESASFTAQDLTLTFEPTPPVPLPAHIASADELISTDDGLIHAVKKNVTVEAGKDSPLWTLSAWLGDAGAPVRLDPASLQDLWVVCHYKVGA